MSFKKSLFALAFSGSVLMTSFYDASAQQLNAKDSITIAIAPEYNKVSGFSSLLAWRKLS